MLSRGRERPRASERGYAGERERRAGEEESEEEKEIVRERREGERKRRKSPSLPYARARAWGREGEKEERLGERMESRKIRRIEEVEI